MECECIAACAIAISQVVVALFVIVAILLQNETSEVGCTLSCNGTQPPFCVIPFSRERQYMKISVNEYGYMEDGLLLRLFNPKDCGKGDFIASGERKNNSLYISPGSIQMVNFMSLSRNSVINIKCSASHSIYLMIHTRNMIEPVPDESSKMKESNMIGSFHDGDVMEYDADIVKKSLFKMKSRNFDINFTVNETSQYVISYGNDSPFNIGIIDFEIGWKSRSPISGTLLSNCTGNQQQVCHLHVPEKYKDDYVSLVICLNCSRMAEATSISKFYVAESTQSAIQIGFGVAGGICAVFFWFLALVFACD